MAQIQMFRRCRLPKRSGGAFLRVCLLLASVTGCGSQSASPADPASAAGQNAASAQLPAAQPPGQNDRQHPVVRIETNMGSITVRLDAEKSPVTVSNFLNYVNEGFYNDTIFHYVDPGKLVMGGGYTREHQLKPPKGPIRNEAHNGRKNLRGTIAMARNPALIDSANSQFFINLADAPVRDHMGVDSPDSYGYCVFGEVTDGLEVAERISRAPTTDRSNLGGDLAQTPQTPVVISAIQIVM